MGMEEGAQGVWRGFEMVETELRGTQKNRLVILGPNEVGNHDYGLLISHLSYVL